MTHGPPARGYPTVLARQHATARQSDGFTLRIGILHGNRLCGELLSAQCADAWGCAVVTLEHAAAEGLESIEHERPDLVIVGHHPPALDCLAVISKLRRHTGIKIVVCARRITEYLVHKLCGTAFHGILEESSAGLTDLQNAILKLREGGRYLSARYLTLAARLRSNPESFSKLLSARQEEVLICIAHEMEDAEIAQTLGMSAATAQRHRTDIMHKLNLHKTPRLIRYCIQAGFDEASLPISRTQTRPSV